MTAQPNLFTRDDTMLGICQGLGEDFGFNPNYLRLALPLPLFLYPAQTIAGYLAMGLIVLIVHWLIPARPARAAKLQPAPREAAPSIFAEEQPLPLAA